LLRTEARATSAALSTAEPHPLLRFLIGLSDNGHRSPAHPASPSTPAKLLGFGLFVTLARRANLPTESWFILCGLMDS
jgi:hypothetical protein